MTDLAAREIPEDERPLHDMLQGFLEDRAYIGHHDHIGDVQTMLKDSRVDFRTILNFLHSFVHPMIYGDQFLK